jgi:Terminase RNaseH-like domain
MRNPYVIGADLGQSKDPTAIAVIQRVKMQGDDAIYRVGHIERLPLHTTYPAVVTYVGRLINRLSWHQEYEPELVIDFTGVGRPVFEMFRGKGYRPIGVTITAGNAESNDGPIWSVPKLTLISTVQALLHAGRLKIQRSLPDVDALIEELQDFRAEVTDSGYWRFGARAGRHDDLVLALAIALWRSVWVNKHVVKIESLVI